MNVVEEKIENLQDYETVSIAFEISSRIDISLLASSGVLREIPAPSQWKNYDDHFDERPTALAKQFDLTTWVILAVFEGKERLGGAMVARDTPSYELLERRADLALIVDLRVSPDARDRGVGRMLFDAAVVWAKGHGCTEIRVETQDTNVAACFFYQAMGCDVYSIDPDAYGTEEVQIIWRKTVE